MIFLDIIAKEFKYPNGEVVKSIYEVVRNSLQGPTLKLLMKYKKIQYRTEVTVTDYHQLLGFKSKKVSSYYEQNKSETN